MKSSTIARMRKRRPSEKGSDRKSRLQRSFAGSAARAHAPHPCETPTPAERHQGYRAASLAGPPPGSRYVPAAGAAAHAEEERCLLALVNIQRQTTATCRRVGPATAPPHVELDRSRPPVEPTRWCAVACAAHSFDACALSLCLCDRTGWLKQTSVKETEDLVSVSFETPPKCNCPSALSM